MFNALQNPLSLIGRVLLALLFIPAGYAKMLGFAATTGYIASKGVPLPAVAAAIAVLVELGLGVLLLVGWQARFAALGIAIFTVVITFVFHPIFGVAAEVVQANSMSFWKNAAIAGGMFSVAAWGAGAWSVDGLTKK
jgi:putative oxidoreductase